MSIAVTFNGTTYSIPSPRESSEWATSLNLFLVALAGALGTNGGTVKNLIVTPTTGRALVLTGTAALAPLKLTPVASGPTGANVVGDIYATTAGVLMICTVAGSPGTFVPVGSQS